MLVSPGTLSEGLAGESVSCYVTTRASYASFSTAMHEHNLVYACTAQYVGIAVRTVAGPDSEKRGQFGLRKAVEGFLTGINVLNAVDVSRLFILVVYWQACKPQAA